MPEPRCKAEMMLLGPIAITWSGIGAGRHRRAQIKEADVK